MPYQHHAELLLTALKEQAVRASQPILSAMRRKAREGEPRRCGLLVTCCQKPLRVLHIRGLEPFCKPGNDLAHELLGFAEFALLCPQAT